MTAPIPGRVVPEMEKIYLILARRDAAQQLKLSKCAGMFDLKWAGFENSFMQELNDYFINKGRSK